MHAPTKMTSTNWAILIGLLTAFALFIAFAVTTEDTDSAGTIPSTPSSTPTTTVAVVTDPLTLLATIAPSISQSSVRAVDESAQDEPADTALQPIPGLGSSDTTLEPIPGLDSGSAPTGPCTWMQGCNDQGNPCLTDPQCGGWDGTQADAPNLPSRQCWYLASCQPYTPGLDPDYKNPVEVCDLPEGWC
jgi:hypothetical protein